MVGQQHSGVPTHLEATVGEGGLGCGVSGGDGTGRVGVSGEPDVGSLGGAGLESDVAVVDDHVPAGDLPRPCEIGHHLFDH